MTPFSRRDLRSRWNFPSWSMATSPHLSLKLREALGPEAGEELIGLVGKAASDISDVRGDIAELRHTMELRFAAIDSQFAQVDARFAEVGTRFAEVGTRFAEVGTRFAEVGTGFASMETQIANVRKDMERQTNRLILWSFAFWVTTLGAILAVR